MAPMRGWKTVGTCHEPERARSQSAVATNHKLRSSRRKEAHSLSSEGSWSLLTSAATISLGQPTEKKRNWRMSEANPKPKNDYWFRDMMLSGGGAWFFLMIPAIIAVLVECLLPIIVQLNPTLNGHQVVVYTSQDQVYVEPILKEFEQQTGFKVRAVHDSEAVKTVGLVNRLLAEKNHPQCDLFWNNEELRTRQLAAQGIFEKWAAMGYRSRRIAINTNQLSLAAAPH